MVAVALTMVFGIATQAEGIAGAATPPPVHLIHGAAAPGPVPTQPLLVNVHNAGDTTASARQAVAAGPSMIELDTSWTGSQVVVAHTLLSQPFRQDAPPLTDAWSRSQGPNAVLVDVKFRSHRGLDALAATLAQHRDRPVYLSTPNPEALGYLHHAAPWTRPLLSLTNQSQLDTLLRDQVHVDGLVGVSIKQSLLTRPVARHLHDRGLLMLAYSVNDLTRVDTLASWGVRAITTDSLPVVGALAPRASIPVGTI